MSLFTPTRINNDFKVRNSDYIHTEHESEEGDSKPAEPVSPETPTEK